MKHVIMLSVVAIFIGSMANLMAAEKTVENYGEPGILTATIERTLTYQGILKTISGDPVPDGSYNVTFRIYDASVGGSSLWSSGVISVVTGGGFFAKELGPIPLPFDEPYYLSIQVASDPEMTPRQKVTMTAYSAVCDTANYALASAGGGGGNWTLSNNILSSNDFWGLTKGNSGNVHYGDSSRSVVNFGAVCTTGTEGLNVVNAVISGGRNNRAWANFSAVGGGMTNKAVGAGSVVAGGTNNEAGDLYSTVSGGWLNNAAGLFSTVGGGISDTAKGVASASLSGFGNIAGDAAVDTGAFIGGGVYNGASDKYATISGGYGNWAGEPYATIGGGIDNSAGGIYSTIGGGISNYNTISGGYNNLTSGFYSTVGGGMENSVSGSYSVITGGAGNYVLGDYSTALGLNDTTGWSGHYSMTFGNTIYNNNDYRVIFFDAGNPGSLNINRDNRDGTVNSYPIQAGNSASNGNGAYLSSGGTWTNGSSRTFKENFTPFDGSELLSKISNLSITTWNFRQSTEKHVGPVAEEFVGAFDTGVIREDDGQRDDKYLAAGDVAGVALAGVQELIHEIEKLKKEIAELKAQHNQEVKK
jgi:hypothetical protein